MRTSRSFTHTTVVAYLALFVALGGTSYAALTVTGRNVKDGSLSGKDVRDASLRARDFAAGQLPAGPGGPAGPQGPQGEAGAAGPQGSRGEAGPPGRDGAGGADGQDGSPDSSGQILDKLRQVDGAGSDLNADLFDGLESSAFQRRGTATSCPTGQVARVLEADGDLVCTPDADTRYSAGTGLSLSGTQLSVTKAPDADRLDGTDSSGFVRAYDTGAFRSARATVQPGGSGGFLSVPGFGFVSLLCSADGSVLSLRFTNTSGAPIAVLADYGATSPVYTVLDHSSTTVAAGGATDSVTFNVGADVGTSHRAATIWAAGAADGTCMGQAQALAHTP